MTSIVDNTAGMIVTRGEAAATGSRKFAIAGLTFTLFGMLVLFATWALDVELLPVTKASRWPLAALMCCFCVAGGHRWIRVRLLPLALS